MSTGDKVTLLGVLLTAIVGLLGMRVQWRITAATAARKRQDNLTVKQEQVTAEQIKADDAERERFNRNIWQLVDELQSERVTQNQRIKTLEEQVSDLRADLEQVRHVERVGRDKVERLTAENTSLRAQVAEVPVLRAKVAELTAENGVLRARIEQLERKSNGDAPLAPAAP